MNRMISIAATVSLLGMLSAVTTPGVASDAPSLVDWKAWSPEVFEQATKENKLVLLNLEAVWCHWCHVMDQETYSDENVADVMQEHFVSIKVDHDAHPDLANRYREWGWPATIIFAGDGSELVKRSGFVPPERFHALLTDIAKDPVPETTGPVNESLSYSHDALLSDDLYAELLRRHARTFDRTLGGYKSKKKTMDRDSTEYDLVRASTGNTEARDMARLTIDASMQLIDPEWGGAYQYSTHGRWDHPHFEKIMVTQAGFLRIYALAYLQWGDQKYLDAAKDIERYLASFLTSPEGAYYTSQDADLVQGEKGAPYFALNDKARREQGIPRIDKNIYSRENGLAIEAVTTLYQVTGDSVFLDRAEKAAEWIVRHRKLGGGYRHDDVDNGGPYLADTLFMGRAFLQLYRATAERRWLDLAAEAGDFIDAHFRQAEAGFLSGVPGKTPIQPVPNLDENVSATRFLNLLSHYTGNAAYRDAAEHAMRYLATEEVATRRLEEGGILLASLELADDPAHYTIVGSKDDPVARSMYDIAVRQSGWYKRVEWWDVDEGPLPNPDVQYPTFDRSAAFVCSAGRCSIPAFGTDQYRELIERLNRPRTGI